MKIVKLMNSPQGRVGWALVGVVLIAAGVLVGGAGGPALALAGLVPLAAGAAGVCLAAPVLGVCLAAPVLGVRLHAR